MLIHRLQKLLNFPAAVPCGFAGALFGGELLAGAMRGAPQCDWLVPPPPKLIQFTSAGQACAPDLINAT